MTTALTPALALDYVTELSADITGGVVLDANGNLLAGPEHLAHRARAVLDAGDSSADGAFAARDDEHAIVVFTGPFALPRLTRHDLLTALSALRRERPGTPSV